MTTMKKTANELRTLVIENSLELGRLTAEQLGDKSDYAHLTALYTKALDELTIWAGKDYKHISVKTDKSPAFEAVKAILALFDNGETRVAIDECAIRTMRDLATKPKRFYSEAYKAANKARKKQADTVADRYADILTLGAPSMNSDETSKDYIARIKALDKDFKVGEVDMLSLYENAVATLVVKEKAVQDIKDAGKWTWRRPVAVTLGEFADLIENYIADCLIDGYNIKSSLEIRKEKEEAAAARKAEIKTKKA